MNASFEQEADGADLKRYLAGVSTQQGSNAPADKQMTHAAQRLLAVTKYDERVVAARATDHWRVRRLQ